MEFLAGMCLALACTLAGVIGTIVVLADREDPPDEGDENIDDFPEPPDLHVTIVRDEALLSR